MKRDHTLQGISFVAVCIIIAVLIYVLIRPAAQHDTVAEANQLTAPSGEIVNDAAVTLDDAPDADAIAPEPEQPAAESEGARPQDDETAPEPRRDQFVRDNEDRSEQEAGDVQPSTATTISAIPPSAPIGPSRAESEDPARMQDGS
jgi:hypothetical protein